ncbi:MAG: hypothetical protein JWP57_4496, partial [Spirosoma sp.]|nr:hypothetical protein [Spirosoma sp.]
SSLSLAPGLAFCAELMVSPVRQAGLLPCRWWFGKERSARTGRYSRDLRHRMNPL